MSANELSLDQFRSAVRDLRAQAQQTRQRRALVLSGDAEWCRQLAREALLAAHLDSDAIWLGHDHPDIDGVTFMNTHQAKKLMGCECSALVYDFYAGFDPDALGIAAGVIKGGGLLILLAPPLTEWPKFKDPQYERILPAGYGPETIGGRFVHRIARILREDGQHCLVEQGFPCPRIDKTPRDEILSPDQHSATEDQDSTVTAICAVARAEKPYPLVIIADRGRGKSAALGFAAAELMKDEKLKIVITALRRDAVAVLFKHAGDKKGNIEFIAPDELLAGNHALDLLLVDEAAAIPAQIIERLLMRYPRIVFTSTVHGYEGSGRGFVTRFFSLLDKRFNHWQLQRLSMPIRWAEGDPVECLVYKLLLLDAEPINEALIHGACADTCTISALNREELVYDEPRLHELFGLLVAAHYRTRPYDLLNLLDGPNISGQLAIDGKHIVGAVLLAEEGNIDPRLAEQIYLGERRPRGHLLPQSLAAHGGLPTAATLKYQRIMRIVVHPAVQQRGIGRWLVSAAEENAKLGGADIIGASFGATAELLDFWLSCGFCVARIGLTREHSSGAHSLMLLKGLTQSGIDMVAKAEGRMSTQFPWLLEGPLKELDQDIASRITLMPRCYELDADDKRDLRAFSEGQRGIEVSYVALAKLEKLLNSNAAVNSDDYRLLSEVICHYGQWSMLAQQHALSGKAALVAALRRTVASNVRQAGITG